MPQLRQRDDDVKLTTFGSARKAFGQQQLSGYGGVGQRFWIEHARSEVVISSSTPHFLTPFTIPILLSGHVCDTPTAIHQEYRNPAGSGRISAFLPFLLFLFAFYCGSDTRTRTLFSHLVNAALFVRMYARRISKFGLWFLMWTPCWYPRLRF